jgi:hypothetical protein
MPCDVTCSTCSGALNSNCLSCNSTLFLDNNYCKVSCSNTFYGNTTLRQCLSCDSTCDTCDGYGPCNYLSNIKNIKNSKIYHYICYFIIIIIFYYYLK